MIEVTQLSGRIFWINPHQIETIESRPDTTIALLNGNRMIVKEDVATVIDRIVAYRRRLGIFKNEE